MNPNGSPSTTSRPGNQTTEPIQDTGKSLKRNSAWMLSGQSLSMAFQALYFVLIGRAIGSHEYGAFVGVASLISVLAQFSGLGMDLIIIRDVSRNPKAFARSWGLALELTTLGFVVVTGIALVIGQFILSPEVRVLIPFIAISDAFFARISVLCSKAYQGFSQFRGSAQIMMLTNAARALFAGLLYAMVMVLHVQATAYLWTRIYWISSLGVALLSLILVTRAFGMPAWAKITGKELSEGFSFSLSSSSISVYNDVDKTMLVSMGMNDAAGIYAAAYRIVDTASTPIYSVFAAAFPQFFREGSKSVKHACVFSLKLLKKTSYYSIAAAALMFFTAPLLSHILGGSFARSSEALRWLCLLPLIRCFHYAGGTTITGSVSQWYRTVQQIAVALLNIGLNAWLIPIYSWRGAAAASLLSDAALAAMNWICVAWLIARQQNAGPTQELADVPEA